MKEFELKYGCNPNQKPVQNLYGRRMQNFRSKFFPEDLDISTSWMHLTAGSW